MSLFTLIKEKKENDDLGFIKDIVKYLFDRLALEGFVATEGSYFANTNPKSVIITIIVTLTINLFKNAVKAESNQEEIELITSLMNEINFAVIEAVKQKRDDENEH